MLPPSRVTVCEPFCGARLSASCSVSSLAQGSFAGPARSLANRMFRAASSALWRREARARPSSPLPPLPPLPHARCADARILTRLQPEHPGAVRSWVRDPSTHSRHAGSKPAATRTSRLQSRFSSARAAMQRMAACFRLSVHGQTTFVAMIHNT
eukprot:6192350-Pleurochrysis_carterae.AAC.2